MKTKLTTILAMSALFASGSVLADSRISMDFTPTRAGTWIQLTQQDMPVAGATVNGQFITDLNGRAFVSSNYEKGRSLNVDVITPEGTRIAKRIYTPRSRA